MNCATTTFQTHLCIWDASENQTHTHAMFGDFILVMKDRRKKSQQMSK
jgi:hypothetical protein